jgi:bifunctional enzyme CysN/CysC
VSIAGPKYKINVNTLEHLAAKTLQQNEIAVCNLNLDQSIAFDPYVENRDTGGFILIDRMTNGTIGAGLLHLRCAVRRTSTGRPSRSTSRRMGRSRGTSPAWYGSPACPAPANRPLRTSSRRSSTRWAGTPTFWTVTTSGTGSTRTWGSPKPTGSRTFGRVAEVSRLMVDAGLIVLVSFISPFRAERRFARERVEPGEFCEIFVDTPLGVAEQRDTKGLYKKHAAAISRTSPDRFALRAAGTRGSARRYGRERAGGCCRIDHRAAAPDGCSRLVRLALPRRLGLSRAVVAP